MDWCARADGKAPGTRSLESCLGPSLAGFGHFSVQLLLPASHLSGSLVKDLALC